MMEGISMTEDIMFYKECLLLPYIDDEHGNRHPKANPPTVGSAATTLRQNSFWIIPYIPPHGNDARLPCGGLF